MSNFHDPVEEDRCKERVESIKSEQEDIKKSLHDLMEVVSHSILEETKAVSSLQTQMQEFRSALLEAANERLRIWEEIKTLQQGLNFHQGETTKEAVNRERSLKWTLLWITGVVSFFSAISGAVAASLLGFILIRLFGN